MRRAVSSGRIIMKRSEKVFYLFSAAFSLALFSFILIKAVNFLFTDDEASSVLDLLYMNLGYFFGSYANTHLINSFFLWIEIHLFGFSELPLRIHSVFAYLLFAWTAFKFTKWVSPVYLRYCLLLAISLHPFLLDFFSMARGYSISFACMMAGLYCFVCFINENKKTTLYASFVWSALAVISCYVMLNFFLSMLCIYFFYSLFQQKEKMTFFRVFTSEKLFWTGSFLFTLFIVALVLRINPTSLTNAWGAKSFWYDSLYSIVSHLTLGISPDAFWPYLVFLLLIIVSLIFSMIDFYKTKRLTIQSFFCFLFLLIYLSYTTQYHVFNIAFVAQRGIIYLYPVIVLLIFFSFINAAPIFVKKIMPVVLLLCTTFMIVNFARNFSIERGVLTPYNDIEAAMKYIESIEHDKKTINLGVYDSGSAPVNYYLLKHNWNWMKNVGAGYRTTIGEYNFYGKVPVQTGRYDYFIIETKNLAEVENFQKIEILKEYPRTTLVLAKAEEETSK